MLLFAIKMLIGDRVKYMGILLALGFASFIISQQGAIFVGIINRTFGFITDTSQPNIWVVDPTVLYIDDVKPLKDTAVFRVRGIEGVEWAVPLYKGLIRARLHNGIFQTCVLIGVDDATLIGAPPLMVQGNTYDLRMPDAIFVDQVGAQTKLATLTQGGKQVDIPLRVGDEIELNDRRAYVAGICQVSRTFQSQPVIYTTYDRATTFAPRERKLLSFVIARAKEGARVQEVIDRINQLPDLKAYTAQGMKDLTLNYYMKYTGIFINFGVAILLGFIIGIAIAGQTFYNFTLDNIRYFGTFKAMGAENGLLVRMILLQALFVSAIGWGIGIGAAAVFGYFLKNTELSFSMPFYLYLASGLSILVICLSAAYFSMSKVKKIDPAIVFKS